MKNYTQHQKNHPSHYSKIADEWESYERRYYRTHTKVCASCNQKIHIDLHHIQPRHISPALIFIESNLIPLCRACHFHIGHLLNWDYFNRHIISDTKLLNTQLQSRRKEYLKIYGGK